MMGDDSPRAAMLGVLRALWKLGAQEIAEAASDEHGPGALHETEAAALEGGVLTDAADYPDWLAPHLARVFGARADEVMRGFSARADVDLRLNTLKTAPEKALAALKTVKAQAVSILTSAARIGRVFAAAATTGPSSARISAGVFTPSDSNDSTSPRPAGLTNGAASTSRTIPA